MYLLIAGMVLWVIIIYRGLRPRLAVESRGNLPWLFLYSSLSIPAFYAIGLMTHTQSTFAIGDFWRFWVVHLWVEDFLELFTTMLVALIFVLMGIVSERFATRLIYFDVMLYSVGGVVGTLHHCYFSGGPAVEMALGAFFSAAEVIPLDVADGRGLVVPPARQSTAGRRRRGVPAPLGGDVPGLGRVLEFPRRRGVRFPDQHADRQLLRDRHAAHVESRSRSLHGRVRHAGPGAARVLHPLPGAARRLERGPGAVFVLGDERRVDADDPRAPVSAGRLAARRRCHQRLLARPDRVVSELSVAVVGANAGRRGVHGRLGPPGLADPQGRAADAQDPGSGGPDGDAVSRPRFTPKSLQPGPLRAAEPGATDTDRTRGASSMLPTVTAWGFTLDLGLVLLLLYLLVLWLGGWLLEFLARAHFHRAERYAHTGFAYDVELDRYECPQGELLTLHTFDDRNKLAIYKAPASSCNECVLKAFCAPHDAGRHVYRSLAEFHETDVGRFHRWLSLVILAVALAFSAGGHARLVEQAGRVAARDRDRHQSRPALARRA